MKIRKVIFSVVFLSIFLVLGSQHIRAQETEPVYRKVTSKDRFKKKTKNKGAKSSAVYKSSIKRRRRPPRRSRKKRAKKTGSKSVRKKKTVVKKPQIITQELGFTLWKLRKKTDLETVPSIPVWEDGVRTDYVPERVESITELSKGDLIRMTIESPQKGYLYVFDREKLSDGTYGEPYLIFPTQRTRNGDNLVEAGKLIGIPAQEDDPPLFMIESDNPYYAGEMLSVVISETPLAEIPTPADAIRIDSDKFNMWLKNWGADSEVYEMDGGKGSVWTEAEKNAGGGKSARGLNQTDPSPQTVYRFKKKTGVPVMVNFVIRVKTDY